MEEKTIRKDDLMSFLADLTGSCQVLAPVRKGDSLVFEEILTRDEIHVSACNTKKSIKEVFFPQRERLFAYRGQETRAPSLPDKERVVFGVRPCDARSLSLLDPVFDGDDFKDPYYCSKRENSTVISIGCNQPMRTCFCADTGGNPFSLDGADVLLVDMGETYFVQPVTQRGERFLEGKIGLEDAEQEQRQRKDEIIEKARESIGSDLNMERIKTVLDRDFDNPFWETLHEKCHGCGVCTFLCPTCHCFDILDEGDGRKGERIRIWDSCMFPLFTLHASGSNPRPGGKERMRQRILHKFKYSVDNHNEVACTGCGRCIRACPVNLDIREVLKEIQNSE
jgi:sulfhydrogenase subunit beta (sulfur reductase)